MVRAQAPGRVNLIGEHTDYNDGFVMPAAIAYETSVAAAVRDDRIVSMTSAHFPQPGRFDLDALASDRRKDWTDYARGVLIELQRAGVPLRGCDCTIDATLPMGAGLSSSASFEVSLALAMLAIAGATMDKREIARLAQRAEIEHVGIRSGIMDQFAVLFGTPHHAVVLDTRSLEFDLAPLSERASIVIANTMVKHALASGEYNKRREQCEEAVHGIAQRYPEVSSLRDATMEQLEACRAELSNVAFRRARHVIAENARVLEAERAMDVDDLRRFGTLMNASHESLRDDYEVSCAELDALVKAARECPGTFGARMTGGGFGGCTVNLVARGTEEAFREHVAGAYHRATGFNPDFYDGTPVAGATVSAALRQAQGDKG